MKSLIEWIQVDTSADEESGEEAPVPHTGLVVDNLIAEWGNIAYAELSIVLVHLRFLAFVHQTNHWTAKGDSYWGDHKLFEELYDGLAEEIDMVGERAVGLGNEANVNLALQLSQVARLSKTSCAPSTIPMGNDLAKRSFVAECTFMKILGAALESMRNNGTSTDGVENLLQGIADKHEQAIYKLKQRCASAALGL